MGDRRKGVNNGGIYVNLDSNNNSKSNEKMESPNDLVECQMKNGSVVELLKREEWMMFMGTMEAKKVFKHMMCVCSFNNCYIKNYVINF